MFYVGTCYRIGEDKDENGGKDSGDREKTIDLLYLEAVLLQRIVVLQGPSSISKLLFTQLPNSYFKF